MLCGIGAPPDGTGGPGEVWPPFWSRPAARRPGCRRPRWRGITSSRLSARRALWDAARPGRRRWPPDRTWFGRGRQGRNNRQSCQRTTLRRQPRHKSGIRRAGRLLARAIPSHILAESARHHLGREIPQSMSRLPGPQIATPGKLGSGRFQRPSNAWPSSERPNNLWPSNPWQAPCAGREKLKRHFSRTALRARFRFERRF